MSVYTFSTKTKRPSDTIVVEEVKKHCENNGMNFSALVIKLLREWNEERQAKV